MKERRKGRGDGRRECTGKPLDSCVVLAERECDMLIRVSRFICPVQISDLQLGLEATKQEHQKCLQLLNSALTHDPRFN